MQQVLRISAQIANAAPRSVPILLANRDSGGVRVDAVAAFLRTIPTNAGAQIATEAELQHLERQIRFRLSLNQQLDQLITPQMVPVRAFISKEVGPVPIEPFTVKGQDQTTIEWEADANLFTLGLFAAGGGSALYLEVIFFGSDGRQR